MEGKVLRGEKRPDHKKGGVNLEDYQYRGTGSSDGAQIV